jgi:hypothetical protein
MNRKFLITLALSFLILPLSAFAQFGGVPGVTPNYADELVVNVTPDYPVPEGRTSINLEMYTENLDSSLIVWSQDGKVVLQGKGKKSFSFTAPKAGKETAIKISITTANGASFSKTITIHPANVDIICEGNSYTPPFYKGRSLWGAQGYIHLVAVPDFSSPSKLIYTWRVNDEVLDQSGYGRDSVSITNNGLGGAIAVELLVTDPSTNTTASNYMVIGPVEPSIVFYENNPLYGIVFDRAISFVNLEKSEMTILAAPFNLFFSQATDVDYKWSVNGASSDALGRAITLRKPDSGSGASSISLEATNTKKLMQFAKSSFLIKFK